MKRGLFRSAVLAFAAFCALPAGAQDVGAPALVDPGITVLPDPATRAPVLRNDPISPVLRTGPTVKTALALSAVFEDGGAAVRSGVHWRVFEGTADANGNHALVAESTDATPILTLDPGVYVVHAVYGLVTEAKRIEVGSSASSERFVLNAGAIRLTGVVGDDKKPSDKLSFTLFRSEGGIQQIVVENLEPGTMVRLPAGTYDVLAVYGAANAKIEADLVVQPGRLTDTTIHHKAAKMTFRLFADAGTAPLGNTSWSILTPGGDTVAETIESTPNIVLSEGDYVAVARNDGRTFQTNFTVKTGVDTAVDLKAE